MKLLLSSYPSEHTGSKGQTLSVEQFLESYPADGSDKNETKADSETACHCGGQVHIVDSGGRPTVPIMSDGGRIRRRVRVRRQLGLEWGWSGW